MPDEGGATTEVIKALKLGMETEKRGLESYLNFARQTKDETGKNMFILLALDELQHFEILERVLTELDISGAWSEIEIKRSLIERVIPKLKERDVRTHGERGIDQSRSAVPPSSIANSLPRQPTRRRARCSRG